MNATAKTTARQGVEACDFSSSAGGAHYKLRLTAGCGV
jgi:hypothetical protein